MADKVHQLDYARTPGLGRRRVFIVIFCNIAFFMFLQFCTEPLVNFEMHLEDRFHERRCMRHVLPPDRIVYSNLPDDVAQLRRLDQYEVQHYDPAHDPCILYICDEARRLYIPHSADSVAFMHRRVSSVGKERLVVLTISGSGQFLVLRPVVITPGALLNFTTSSPILTESMFLEPAGPVASSPELYKSVPMRLFAGQTDPQDDSHFTFVCEVDGDQHVFDGRLQDDDTVELRARSGVHSGKFWYPDASVVP